MNSQMLNYKRELGLCQYEMEMIKVNRDQIERRTLNIENRDPWA